MTKTNPFKLLVGWTIVMIVLTPILVYTLSTGTSGGEQRAFTTLSTMIIVWLIGASVTAIITPFIYPSWFSSNKWFIVLPIFLLLSAALFLWTFFSETRYSSVEKNREIGRNKIVIKTEYYDDENRFIRINKFWKNGKKDSTWTTLSKEGKIIRQETYRDGVLIERK